MAVLVKNNAFSTLASGITNVATSITLAAGTGSRFPAAGGADYFYATLINTSNQLEVVKVTARSTDTLTVVRGQDGTTARAYSTGDRIELRVVAALIADIRDSIAPADNTVTTAKIVDGAVTAAKIAADAVTSTKILDANVLTAKLADNAVTAAKIASDAVITAKILNSNVTTAKIADAAITPAKLSGAQSGSAPIFGVRAWVNFDGTGTVAIRASGNVSSITDNGVGTYTINLTTALPDANPCIVATAGDVSWGNYADVSINAAPTSTAIRVAITCQSGGNPARTDISYVCVQVLR